MMRQIGRWAAILALGLSASPAAADPAAVRFLAGKGHRLAAADPAPADLAPIVARLSGARVIGVGEATHGTHEDQAFKAALIKALVAAGAIDTLALEANRAAGRGFDRYVRLGEGDPVALIRSPSFFRIWKGDEFAGLLIWLRAWNLAHADRPVRVIGIDNQDAGVDAGAALAFVRRRDPALAARLRPAFGTLMTDAGERTVNPSAWIQTSRPGELAAAMAAAATLRDTLAARRAAWGGDPNYADALHAATVAWQNLHEYEREVGIVDLATLPIDYMARRDRYMAQNLAALLAPGNRAAFWAHDLHVVAAVEPGAAAKGALTIGSELRRMLGDRYRSLGFTYSRATVLARRVASAALDHANAADDTPVALANDRPQDLGSVFARLPGDAWWIDLATPPGSPAVARWLARPMWRGWAGSVVAPDRFQPYDKDDLPPVTGAGFDVLVWFRTMTPQHRWPVAPPAPRP